MVWGVGYPDLSVSTTIKKKPFVCLLLSNFYDFKCNFRAPKFELFYLSLIFNSIFPQPPPPLLENRKRTILQLFAEILAMVTCQIIEGKKEEGRVGGKGWR